MNARWQRLWRPFDAFFFAPTSTIGARAYRIALGVWTALFLLPRLPHAEEIYARPILRQVAKPWKWLGDPIPPVWLVESAIVVTSILALWFAFSRRPRALHFAVLVPLSFLFAIDTVMPRAYGGLAYLQWWLFLFAPYDSALNDDKTFTKAPPVGTRMVQVQFALVYFFAVFSKVLDGGGWLNGNAVFNSMNSTRYGDFMLSSWGVSHEVAFVFAWGTLVGEFVVGVGLFWRRSRPIALLAVLGLHVGMMLFLRVSPHFHALMISHCLLFLPDEWWAKILGTRIASNTVENVPADDDVRVDGAVAPVANVVRFDLPRDDDGATSAPPTPETTDDDDHG